MVRPSREQNNHWFVVPKRLVVNNNMRPQTTLNMILSVGMTQCYIYVLCTSYSISKCQIGSLDIIEHQQPYLV